MQTDKLLCQVSPDEILSNLAELGQLCFEVTDACNLACDYCVYRDLFSDHDPRNGKMMDFGLVKRLLDYLVELWDQHPTGKVNDYTAISFYGGEPLLNMPLIKRTIEYIEGLHLKRIIRFNLTTNATLLDRHIDYLVEKEFNLLISLDGDQLSDRHRRYHSGKESFIDVFSNAKKLKERYPDYFREKVQFNAVLHNYNDVEPIVQFMKREFGKVPSISEINPRGLDPEKKKEYLAMYNNFYTSLDRVKDADYLVEEMGFSHPETEDLIRYMRYVGGNYYSGYFSLLSNTLMRPNRPAPGTCSPFQKKMFVTVNGKILQCERIGHNFSLGTVSADRIDLNLDQISERFNGWVNGLSKSCLHCGNLGICQRCFFNVYGVETARPVCQFHSPTGKLNMISRDSRAFVAKHPELFYKIIESYSIQ